MDSGPVARMVFGDDQSQSADVAWLWVSCHEWPGWQVEVVTATPVEVPGPPELDPWSPRHPRQLPGHDRDATLLHERVAADPTAALAAFHDRDLLVIGPKGRGFRKTLHIGSVSEAMANRPPMPVVIARHGVPTERVLVCADGSPHSDAAVAALLRMPWIGRVEVAVACVPEPGVEPDQALAAAGRIGDAARSTRTEVLRPDPLQVAYHPRDMLLEAARTWGADLLVLGSRGLSGLAAVRAGSIAGTLAARAECSVLIARAT